MVLTLGTREGLRSPLTRFRRRTTPSPAKVFSYTLSLLTPVKVFWHGPYLQIQYS